MRWDREGSRRGLGLKLGGRRTEARGRRRAERRARRGPSGGWGATCRAHGQKALVGGAARIQVPLSTSRPSGQNAARRQRREVRDAGQAVATRSLAHTHLHTPTTAGVGLGMGGGGGGGRCRFRLSLKATGGTPRRSAGAPPRGSRWHGNATWGAMHAGGAMHRPQPPWTGMPAGSGGASPVTGGAAWHTAAGWLCAWPASEQPPSVYACTQRRRGVGWQATAGGQPHGSTCPTADRQTWLAPCELCHQLLWLRPPVPCARRDSPRVQPTACVHGCSSLARCRSCERHRMDPDCLVEGRA